MDSESMGIYLLRRCIYQANAVEGHTASSANDNGPGAQEPDKVKVSRPVR
jgi:hypothetical protein